MKNNNLKWKDYFKKGKEMLICTASKNGQPNGIIVISHGFVDNKLLIADCQMKNTLKNLLENNNICVISGYLKIIGKTKIINQGKCFNIANRKPDGYPVKNAIVVTPKKLINLDKVKVLNLKL